MGIDHHVLLIDNEHYLRKTFQLILQKAGYSVTAAIDIQEALHWLEGESFHSLILNLNSLDHHSQEFLSRLQEHTQEKLQVLFLVCDDDTIPQLKPPSNIDVKYIHLPIEPNLVLDTLATRNGHHTEEEVIV